MNFLLFFIFFVPNDSIVATQQDSLQSKSIMFNTTNTKDIKAIRHQHIQGFFCDFEDKINKGKKININVGVGAQ